MKTAVEWLENELNLKGKLTPVDFYQAKEMEKEQMFAYTKEKQVIGENSMKFFTEDFEQYYNETFKSE